MRTNKAAARANARLLSSVAGRLFHAPSPGSPDKLYNDTEKLLRLLNVWEVTCVSQQNQSCVRECGLPFVIGLCGIDALRPSNHENRKAALTEVLPPVKITQRCHRQ